MASLLHSLAGAPQTVDGRPAQGFTKDEFKALFKKIKDKVDAKLKKNPKLFKVQPHYKIDMASWQHFTPEELGIKKSLLLRSPPVGAELQKPVEHQISGAKRRFKRAYNDDPTIQEGSPEAVALFKREAKKINQKKVQSDVRSLKRTYQNVKSKKGGYANPPNR